MDTIEIVSHGWAGSLPIYAQHLRFQLASLLNHPTDAQVLYTLFWAGPEFDPVLASVIDDFASECHHARKRVTFQPIIQPREKLFRRAIGRHQRSQQTNCRLIWYCDIDYYFGAGAIDSVCGQATDYGKLYFPRKCQISINHELGDSETQNINQKWPTVDPSKYKTTRNKLAIGGIQILRADCAREVGYFNPKSKWHKDVDPNGGFSCFRDDSAWRRQEFPLPKQCGFLVPNLYRIRHVQSSLRPQGFVKP